ncbi:MAG: type I restriction endonuclease, partial [Candidatus Sumerlaeota bacterium]|nr:type I restriction endonuclease [Candidatus Sumerlaeota bacterium]
MISKDEARKKIEQLVEKFEENKEFYLSPDYNETQTRREFIDPFFKALGWDMDNEKNEPEPYKDVIHEDKIHDGKGVKAPDYCFTIYGHKKFFVEAKKPSVDIKDQISPIYQIRRYGWSASLPVCVLTDFEEFAIYQCTKKPTPNDKPIDERIGYFRYEQYIEEFDYIWEYFSRESVHHGSLDKLVKSDIARRGTETVNKEFLKSLEEWRKLLAVNIALRNPSLTEEEINYAVQQTIDRIIFLRICEDRKVEKYARLSEHLNGDNFYQNLF